MVVMLVVLTVVYSADLLGRWMVVQWVVLLVVLLVEPLGELKVWKLVVGLEHLLGGS